MSYKADVSSASPSSERKWEKNGKMKDPGNEVALDSVFKRTKKPFQAEPVIVRPVPFSAIMELLAEEAEFSHIYYSRRFRYKNKPCFWRSHDNSFLIQPALSRVTNRALYILP